MSYPYLGPERPLVIEIPMEIGVFTRTYIELYMSGWPVTEHLLRLGLYARLLHCIYAFRDRR